MSIGTYGEPDAVSNAIGTDCAARILHIGICWSERKRGSAGNTAVGPKDRKEGMLRSEGNLRYPAALRSARSDSDYC